MGIVAGVPDQGDTCGEWFVPTSLLLDVDKSQHGDIACNVMLRRVQSFDWASTARGGIDTWPEDLRGVCRTVLLSPTPTSVLIGREGLIIYNDAVRSLLGPDSDDLLGKQVAEALPEVGNFCRSMLEQVFRGQPSSVRELALTLTRGGGRSGRGSTSVSRPSSIRMGRSWVRSS